MNPMVDAIMRQTLALGITERDEVATDAIIRMRSQLGLELDNNYAVAVTIRMRIRYRVNEAASHVGRDVGDLLAEELRERGA